jgi:protein-tyrosine phosphatase
MKDVYWIDDPSETRLAIASRPRGGEWLEEDLFRLKRAGIDILVSMLTSEEEQELGLEHERGLAEKIGLGFYSYPIPDRSTPRHLETFQVLVRNLANEIKRGKKVGAHCRGCIGRSTLITASILISKGWKADRALTAIEAARGCPVPDTAEQRRWVESFSLETS